MPFFAITLLAGLQTISPDLHEAASLDGANAWQRFWHVTWPLLKPVTIVVVVFSVIQTFADFQLIYVLTGGGPGQLHAPDRDVRLPDRRGHRAPRRGRRHLAVHAPRPPRRRVGAAPLPPTAGGREVIEQRLEEVGLLLHPADALRRRDPLPVLLDAHHRVPAGPRAVPVLASREQHAALDARPDARPLPGPPGPDDVPVRGSGTRSSSRWSPPAISLFCGLLAGLCPGPSAASPWRGPSAPPSS